MWTIRYEDLYSVMIRDVGLLGYAELFREWSWHGFADQIGSSRATSTTFTRSTVGSPLSHQAITTPTQNTMVSSSSLSASKPLQTQELEGPQNPASMMTSATSCSTSKPLWIQQLENPPRAVSKASLADPPGYPSEGPSSKVKQATPHFTKVVLIQSNRARERNYPPRRNLLRRRRIL